MIIAKFWSVCFFIIHTLCNSTWISVPTLIGATKDEGLLSSAQYIANPALFEPLKTSWVDFAAKTFMGQYFQEPLSKDLQKKADAIARFYFKDGFEFDSQEGFKNLTDAFGDSGFLYGTHLMAGYG